MEHIFGLIDPVPDLMHNSPAPLVGIEAGLLDGWFFDKKLVVISDAGHQQSVRLEHRPDRQCGVGEPIRR
jgi:hypothetical protein